jgi:anti-sigma B factor antagonist
MKPLINLSVTYELHSLDADSIRLAETLEFRLSYSHNSEVLGGKVEIQQRTAGPGITVIALEGRIVLGSEGMAVKNAIDGILDGGSNKLVVDMSKVSYIDSAGLGIVVSAMSKTKESGGEFCMAETPDIVRQVFKVTNVLQLLTLHDTVDAAVAAVQG